MEPLLLMEESMTQYPASERWIHPSCDLIIFFPPPSRVLNMKLEACLDVCREMGLQKFWPTMCILVDERTKAYTIAFNTQYEPPTYESIMAEKEPPVIELFEWPDRFFVEAKSKDYWARIYGGDIAPHLVDLSIPSCDCQDFERNVRQARKYGGTRKVCAHIVAAREEQERLLKSLQEQSPA